MAAQGRQVWTRRALRSVGVVIIVAWIAVLLPVAQAGAVGTTITVDRLDDTASASACTAAANDCSLRGAVTFANANPGTTIDVPAGTYQLTIDGTSEGGNCGNAAIGDLDIAGNNTQIVGAGAASTVIEQTQPHDRVICVDQFLVGNFTFGISDLTIAGGRETQGVGGGGIISGGAGDVTNVSGVTFVDNQASGGGSPIGGALGNGAGTLNVTNSTFGGANAPCASQADLSCSNQSVGSGGAIYYSANNAAGSFTLSGSKFTNNVTTGGDGGAIKATQSATTYSISTSTFVGNQARGATATGGAVVDESGTMSIDHSVFVGNAVTQSAGRGGALGSVDGGAHNINVQYSRFVGNTAATTANGSALYTGYGSTTTATDDWWGCNGGPNAAGCGTITNSPPFSTFAGGVTNFTPWIVLHNSASPNPIAVDQASTLTADVLHDSSGGSLTTSQVSALVGAPVSWGSAVSGTLSSMQSAIQPSGTATATFTGTAASAGSAQVSLDNATVTAAVTVDKANTTTAVTGESADPTVTGQPYTVSYSVSGASGVSPTAPTGSVTVSDGTDSCTASVAAGQCTLTSTTAGAKTLTATYSGDANFNGSVSTGEAHSVDEAPAITSSGSTTFTVGSAGTFPVTATGSPVPTFSEVGALPSGVTLTSAGVLSGTPAAGTNGTYPITITATNGVSPDATQSFTLTVDDVTTSYTSNYTSDELGWLTRDAAYLHSPDLAHAQHDAAIFLVFLGDIIQNNALAAPNLGSNPGTGPQTMTSTYTSGETAALAQASTLFSSDPPTIQRVGAGLLAYLLAISGH